MSETMLGNNNESEKNKGPEEAPSLSPELEAAMNKVERLENECKEYREVLSAIIESDIKAYGGEENISPRISDYHNQSAAYLEGLENQLASAKDEVSLLEKENNEESVEDGVVEAEESENAEGEILESIAAAETDPSKKEKIPRWKKIGGAILGAAILGGAIFGGVSLNNQLNSDEGPQSGDAGVSSEASSEYFSDVMEVGSVSGHEQEANIESVGDYEVANYGFFNENKSHYNDMGPAGEVLDVNGNLKGESLEEQRQIVIDEWEAIGKEDPHRAAVAYISLVYGGDYENHDVEALEAQFLQNPDSWQDAHEKIMEKLQDGNITFKSLDGLSYYSMYNIIGADGTPEMVQSYIENGDGFAIVIETEVNGEVQQQMWRADCGWQVISINEIPNIPVTIIDTSDSSVPTRPTTPEEPEIPVIPPPGPEEPEIPVIPPPGPEEPEPETEKPKSENPDDYKGGGNPVLEIQTPAEKEPSAVENPAPPSGEIPIIQAPDVELGGDDDVVINIEDIPEEVINGGEAEAPVVDGETEEGI